MLAKTLEKNAVVTIPKNSLPMEVLYYFDINLDQRSEIIKYMSFGLFMDIIYSVLNWWTEPVVQKLSNVVLRM